MTSNLRSEHFSGLEQCYFNYWQFCTILLFGLQTVVTLCTPVQFILSKYLFMSPFPSVFANVSVNQLDIFFSYLTEAAGVSLLHAQPIVGILPQPDTLGMR